MRSAVSYVESRRHLIGICRRKASGREYQLVNHRRIDDAQPLLLSVGDEQPAKKLHAVDIDTVFIVGAAAYRISRRQFIGWSNAGKCRQHRLDAPTRYIGRMSVGIGIDLLHRAELLLVLSNLHLTQLARGLFEFHVDCKIVASHLHKLALAVTITDT